MFVGFYVCRVLCFGVLCLYGSMFVVFHVCRGLCV